MQDRDKQTDETSPAGAEKETPASIASEVIVRRQSSEQIFQRATKGLIRVESRRRWRAMFRRTLILAVIALLGYGGWHLFGDRVPYEWLRSVWENLMSKFEPIVSEQLGR